MIEMDDCIWHSGQVGCALSCTTVAVLLIEVQGHVLELAGQVAILWIDLAKAHSRIDLNFVWSLVQKYNLSRCAVSNLVGGAVLPHRSR